MMKRYVAICLAVIVAAGLLFIITPNTQAAEEGTIRTMLKTLPLESVTYNYKDSNTAKSASVYFSPALLLQDADKLKDTPVMGEIAKASVALAMAAYEPDYINSLLSGMGFTAYDNSYVYHRSRNELTLDDNDYVAYTIAYRDVENPIDGKTYRIYCVPIQGTPQNAEWFSDFNLGKDDEHEGFRKASQEVYDRLQTFFVSDGKNADTRIVWVTGHSRGAACANLIAGWLSDSKEINTKAEHVFGYTYACPAVSLKADTTLKNIFNFNNIGDMVTMLPMEEWGYRRYGQDVLLDTSEIQLNNVRQQFKNTTNSTYAGEITDVNYKKLLTEVIGTDREAFNNSATLQAVLGIAGWALGGKNDAGIIPVIHKYLNVADQAEIKLEYNGWSIKTFFELLGTKYDENDELSVWAYQAYNETLEMTQEEFSSYLSTNNAKIYKLREETGIEIVDAQSFLIANGKLNKANNIIRSAAECVSAAMALVSDEDGEIMDKILHGHSQVTYTVWINSMYCGYKGWYDNDEIQGAYAERVCLSVGDYTFYGCDSLEEVTLPDFLGGGACANCLGLRTVTLPADYDLSKSPFYNTCGVTTIYYTPGQTGIMMDRESNSYTVGYNYTLEYCSRNAIETIEFAEGITHIADYLFYGGYHDGFLVDNSSLKTVQLPSTLETIGDYAFYGCRSITSLTLPQSVTSIGDYAFTKCGGIATLDIPATMTYIGTSAFQSCNSLKVLSLPDTGLSIGGGAFSECTGLRTVTLPADYDIKQSPFYNTCGVTTIYYTPGQTGVMMDRESNSYSVGYNYTLEYYSRNAIETVKFAEGITHIADYLFYGGYQDGFLAWNRSLKTVQLPSTVETIGDYAFCLCGALTDIALGESLTSIGDYAFYECSNITSLTLPQSVTSIGNYGFANCGGIPRKLDVPETMTYIGANAFWSCDSLEELILPNTGLSIGGGAFSECTGLRTVTLPADYDIKQSPFYNTCGVTTIYYTPGQTGIMMDRESNSYTVGYNYTLEYCSRNAIETIEFAEGITHIADYLFYGGYHDGFLVDNSSLKTVQLPSTLESVGGYAFFNCSALTDVFYCGTQEQWFMIALGNNNSSLTNMTPQLHHYENGVCTFCGHSILVVGDMDGNQVVDHNDAIYLLLHTMFGENAYPLNGADADIDGNGAIEQEDAVYLLLHTMFGEAFYPLKRS